MPDDGNTPGEPITPPQQVNPPPATQGGEDWEARAKGLFKKVEELTLANRDLNNQLLAKTSEIERLSADLVVKDTEKQVSVGERDKKISEIIEAKNQADSELARLRALELKVKVANKLGQTSLLTIIDSIPNIESEETLEAFMKNISDWGTAQVRQREQELLAGTMPEPSAPPATTAVLPSSNEGWQKFVNEVPLGTPEREQRMNAWRDWGLSLGK